MTRFYEVDGIKYAEGVEPAAEGSDPEVAADLQRPGKIRITTMIDEDLYKALKQAAHRFGDGRYQTYLNQILRSVLMGPAGLGRPAPTSEFELIRMVQEMQKVMVTLQARVDEMGAKTKAAPRAGTLGKRVAALTKSPKKDKVQRR